MYVLTFISYIYMFKVTLWIVFSWCCGECLDKTMLDETDNGTKIQRKKSKLHWSTQPCDGLLAASEKPWTQCIYILYSLTLSAALLTPLENYSMQTASHRARELCESRGGRPVFPSLISLRFLWKVKQNFSCKSRRKGDNLKLNCHRWLPFEVAFKLEF